MANTDYSNLWILALHVCNYMNVCRCQGTRNGISIRRKQKRDIKREEIRGRVPEHTSYKKEGEGGGHQSTCDIKEKGRGREAPGYMWHKVKVGTLHMREEWGQQNRERRGQGKGHPMQSTSCKKKKRIKNKDSNYLLIINILQSNPTAEESKNV